MSDGFGAVLRRSLGVPIAAVRPYLAFKGTLLLLAFDMWLTRASHAGRYGAGGFNVAHWPWLDWVQPPISPPLYVGACVLTSALCLTLVFADRPPRWLIGLTFLVHTWSWAMSMLDSYQHHYLLSIVLLCMVFFPPLSLEEALRLDPKTPDTEPPRATKPAAKGGKKKKRKGKSDSPLVEGDAPPSPRGSSGLLAPYPFVSAWSYFLLAGSTAIVYAYTAYSKTDPEWLSGASLRQVMHYPADGVVPGENANVVIRLFHSVIERFGDEAPTFWFLMGHSVVLVQLVIAAGYLLAPWRDLLRSWVAHAFFFVALATALSFHVGAELMGLEIGWFSYYMIGYALVMFLPAEMLVAAARAVLWPKGERYGFQAILVRIGVAVLAAYLAHALESSVLGWTALLVLVGSFIRVASRATWLPSLELLPEPVPLVLAALAASATVLVGWIADLPGAFEASVIAAALLGAGVVGALVRDGHARALHGYAIGALTAAIALAVCVQTSAMRWDYWRNVGGDHRRRGEVEEAYLAYVKANDYAPEDDDREDEEEEMRRILVQRGVLPAGEAP